MEERYHRHSTIITTNLVYDEWQSFLGNKSMVEALLSRVRHYCHTVTIDGPSLRDPQGCPDSWISRNISTGCSKLIVRLRAPAASYAAATACWLHSFINADCHSSPSKTHSPSPLSAGLRGLSGPHRWQ